MSIRLAICALSIAVLGAAGCDTPATASDPRGAAPRGDQLSREYESCAASAQCAPGLRCFEQACRRTERSVLGDYTAAMGQSARARGELDAAIALYAEALSRYDAESVPPPPDLDCAYGDTLVGARVNKERAELAARVLHRCLVAVPVGSALHDRAMAGLAELFDSGLDPVHLARTAPADIYLTRAAARPDASALKVTVAAEPMPTGKSFPAVLARLGEGDVRAPLIACWEAYATATKKLALAVQVPVKARIVSDYDDEPGKLVVGLEGPVPSGNSAEETAAACVRAAVEPVLKDLKGVRESFTTTLTVRLQ
jgi:hypothetical protein